ncbi:MAG: hypothetical protein J5794_01450 [Lachnospiraceae bacterium]|nr:hypothetical protein [Lachnospiraceae bacterium]
MKLRTARTLQIIAFVFFAAAFVLSIVSIFIQNTIKTAFSAAPALRNVFVIPYYVILACTIHLGIALIPFLVLLKKPTRKATIVATIIVAVLTVVNGALSMLLSTLITAMVGRLGGSEVLAAYTTVSSGASFLTSLFTTPAAVLMFLSLGGACGKDYSQQG